MIGEVESYAPVSLLVTCKSHYMHTPFKSMFRAACMLVLIVGFQSSFAQGRGSVMGQVTDPDTKAPAADVTVVFENQGMQKMFTTNDNGFYYASNLPEGVYTVTAAYMSSHVKLLNVKVTDEQKILDITLSAAVQQDTIFVTVDRVIDPLGDNKIRLTREDIKNEPITKIDDITATMPGVVEMGGVLYVHGSREGALAYVIDGSPVMAKADIPLCGLETYTIYDGFIPPKYGDTVGGVVVLETRNFFSRSH